MARGIDKGLTGSLTQAAPRRDRIVVVAAVLGVATLCWVGSGANSAIG